MLEAFVNRMSYPCPACGFEVFDDLPGSYDLCPICDWEDDGVQLRFPSMRGGANGESLFEYQQKVLKTFFLSVKEVKGYRRDEQWRPLTPADCQDTEGMPQSGRAYFDSIDAEEPRYYWRV
jgi:hypothetical protein